EMTQGKSFERSEPLQGPDRGFIEGIAYTLSRVPWKMVFVLVLLVTVLGGILWGTQQYEAYKNRDPLEDLPIGYYEPSKALPGEFLPPSAPQP
ncbi:MAG: hypothetical protein VYE02_12910, partial [Verrucomicrobiota bacterium]|nr:hypothetical protein [Verrucomicrobiota bacterium]